MQEKICFSSVVTTVVVTLFGCVSPPKIANNCHIRDEEIPAGYARGECHCEKSAVQTTEASDVDWDRSMGRKPTGEATTSTTGTTGFSATTSTRVTTSPDYSIHCEKTNWTKTRETSPISKLDKFCGTNGMIYECSNQT